MQQTENLAPHVQEIARALTNRMEPDAIEDELRRYLEYGVPLAQAKRDIVRMHGGQLNAGDKKLATLQAEDRGVDLVAKVLTVNPKEINVKGQAKTIFYGLIADDTGKTAYTAWKDFKLQKGSYYKFRNAYAKKGFREGVDLQLGDYSVAEPAADPGWVIQDAYEGSGGAAGGNFGGSRVTTERAVRDLKDGMTSVAVTGRVLDMGKKTINTVNGPKELVEGVLADETGRVAFSAWEPEKLPAGFAANAVVHVKGAYVRAFRGIPQLNFGQYANVEVLPANALPDASSLEQEKPFTLGELEAAGGGEGVLVEGIVLEVKKGSGIIERCSAQETGRACNRILLKRECRVHGKQSPLYDLRIKAVLDDGHGAATFFADRDVTEKILGKTLDQAREQARDAMTVDVIQDELTEKLTARRVVIRGRASSDDFGLTLNARSLEFVTNTNTQAEAEKLLGQLAEYTEVA